MHSPGNEAMYLHVYFLCVCNIHVRVYIMYVRTCTCMQMVTRLSLPPWKKKVRLMMTLGFVYYMIMDDVCNLYRVFSDCVPATNEE